MMICPQCGATYSDAAFCINDGTALVSQPVASQPAVSWPGQVPPPVGGFSAPTIWPQPPAPKRSGGLLALVLAITLVVVIAVGVFLLARNKSDDLGSPTVTLTVTVTVTPSPVSTPTNTNWAGGVTQQWQQTFNSGPALWNYDEDVIAMSPDYWLVEEDKSAVGVNASTGEILWRIDFNTESWGGCTHTLFNGQWACLEPDQVNSSQQDVCLINAIDGEQTCVNVTGVAIPSDSEVWWGSLWFADNELIIGGSAGGDQSDWPGRALARLSLPSLKVEWARSYVTDCSGGWSQPIVPQKNTEGVTGNVFWAGGPIDTGPIPLAVDITNGRPLFAQSALGLCASIFPVNADTFMAGPDVPAGPMTLPGGGQINIVNQGGAIEYKSRQLPTMPVYYTPSGLNPDSGMYDQATLGAGGKDWPVSLPLQQMMAAGGATYLRGAANGYTLVVVGADGQVIAVDCTSGQEIWSATLPAASSDVSVAIVGNIAAFTTDSDQVTLLSLVDGQQIERMPGYAFVSPGGDALAVVDMTSTGMTITRYVPAT